MTADFVTSYDAGAGEYVVTDVTVGGIAAACDTDAIEVTLTDAGGAVIGTGSGVVSSPSTTVALAAPASAEALEGIAIVIAG